VPTGSASKGPWKRRTGVPRPPTSALTIIHIYTTIYISLMGAGRKTFRLPVKGLDALDRIYASDLEILLIAYMLNPSNLPTGVNLTSNLHEKNNINSIK